MEDTAAAEDMDRHVDDMEHIDRLAMYTPPSRRKWRHREKFLPKAISIVLNIDPGRFISLADLESRYQQFWGWPLPWQNISQSPGAYKNITCLQVHGTTFIRSTNNVDRDAVVHRSRPCEIITSPLVRAIKIDWLCKDSTVLRLEQIVDLYKSLYNDSPELDDGSLAQIIAESTHLSLRNGSHTLNAAPIPPLPDSVVVYRHGGKMDHGGSRPKGQGDYDLSRVCSDWFAGSSACSSPLTPCDKIHGLTTGEPLCPHMFKMQKRQNLPKPICFIFSCPHVHAQDVKLPAIDPRPLYVLAERLYQDLTDAEAGDNLHEPRLPPLQIPVPVRLRHMPGTPIRSIGKTMIAARFFMTNFVCYRDIAQCHFGSNCFLFFTYAGCFYRHRHCKRARSISPSRSMSRSMSMSLSKGKDFPVELAVKEEAKIEVLSSHGDQEPKQEPEKSWPYSEASMAQSSPGKVSATYLPSPVDSPDSFHKLVRVSGDYNNRFHQNASLPSPPADFPSLQNKRPSPLQKDDHECSPRKAIKMEQESQVARLPMRRLPCKEDSPSPSRSSTSTVDPTNALLLSKDDGMGDKVGDDINGQIEHSDESTVTDLVLMDFSSVDSHFNIAANDSHSLPRDESTSSLLSAIAKSTSLAKVALRQMSSNICMSKALDVKKDKSGRWMPVVGVVESKTGKRSTTNDSNGSRFETNIDAAEEINQSRNALVECQSKGKGKGKGSVCHTAPLIDVVQQYINPLCHEKNIKALESGNTIFPARPATSQDKTWKARVRELAAYELIYMVNDYGGAGMNL